MDTVIESPWMVGILGLLAGYILGSIPFAYIVAKQLHGIDIREHGSGNVGATNVRRVCGKRSGQLVLLFDCMKGFIPVLVSQQFIIPDFPWGHVIVAIGLVLGHSKSMFLGFSGGKSAATGLGAVVALNPLAGLTVAAIAASVTFLSRYVSVGSITAAAAAPVLFYFYSTPMAYVVFAATAGIYVILKHRSNIQRLLQGTENRLS